MSAPGERSDAQRLLQACPRSSGRWSLGAMTLLLLGLLAMHGFWGAEAGAAHHSSPASPVVAVEQHAVADQPAGAAAPASAPGDVSLSAGLASEGEVLVTCLLALTGVVSLLVTARRRSPVVRPGWAGPAAPRPVRILVRLQWRPVRDLGTALCVMRV